jgi:hypothetical protein
VRLDVPQLATSLELPSAQPAPEAPLEVSERFTPERVELAARSDLLEHLASTTGGRLLADHEALELPELLQGRTLETVRTAETPLWDTPWALAVFFTLLALEWALRKRAGLP